MDITRGDDAARTRGYLAVQAGGLRRLGTAAATGDDEAVHDARTATRRLRTALGLAGPLVGGADPLRDALRDLGRALGTVRDPAVELAWLRDALDGLPGDDLRPRARLVENRLAARRAGLVVLRRQLRSATHARLLAGLDALVEQPWGPDEGGIRRRAARQWHRLDHALEAADEAGHGERDAALHAVRRQARRARYAAEVVGDDATGSAALAERLQDELGAQHDAVLVRAVLAEVAAQATAAGESRSTYDRLSELAADGAARAERGARRAAAAAGTAGHRGWMP